MENINLKKVQNEQTHGGNNIKQETKQTSTHK